LLTSPFLRNCKNCSWQICVLGGPWLRRPLISGRRNLRTSHPRARSNWTAVARDRVGVGR
jgi:hypothetical protein